MDLKPALSSLHCTDIEQNEISFLCELNVKTFVLSIFYHCLTMHVLISPKNESCNNGYDINVGCIKEKLNHFSAVWTPSHEST